MNMDYIEESKDKRFQIEVESLGGGRDSLNPQQNLSQDIEFNQRIH